MTRFGRGSKCDDGRPVRERRGRDGARAGRAREPLPYDANKAPEEIEDDILRTRRHLSVTIEALERRLAPRRLIARSTETFLNALEGDTEQLAARLRENAVPLLLIVAGAAWLLLQRHSEAARARREEQAR
jgi:Protein of unknown function (DUF3618)